MQWPQQPGQAAAPQRFPQATPPVSAAGQPPRFGVPPAQGSPAPHSQPQPPTPAAYPPQSG